jgi:hypothetical protein
MKVLYFAGGIVARQTTRTIRMTVIAIQMVIRMQFRLRFGSGDESGEAMVGFLRVGFST